MGRTVGILLDDHAFQNIRRKRVGYERIRLYERAARELSLRPFFLNLNRMGLGKAHGYAVTARGLRPAHRPIPRVIHNREMALKHDLKRKLDRLAKGRILFNRLNRYSKYRIHQLVRGNPELRSCLPHTRRFNMEQLKRAMRELPSFFVKPVSSSVGLGIVKLTRLPGGRWRLEGGTGFRPVVRSASQACREMLRLTGGRSYLIQETIPLATYKGRPYDLRVSVQRNGTGQWQVTGVFGKVAAKGKPVTNVAQGGRVYRCEVLLEAAGLPVDATKTAISQLSLRIAEHLSGKLPHLADLGLDIGVDRSGRLYLIEVNGRDQRIGFHKAGMKDTFYRTYYNPLEYAAKQLL